MRKQVSLFRSCTLCVTKSCGNITHCCDDESVSLAKGVLRGQVLQTKKTVQHVFQPLQQDRNLLARAPLHPPKGGE